jgi:hypothetical protein
MSQQITTAFVQQYSANIFHLAQQKGSRLRNLVRSEMQVGKSAFYDRIGATAAYKKTGRHSDTLHVDSEHSRRRVTLEDYAWADLIDQEDKIRMLINPESEYAKSAMWALGRSIDDVVIEAALGTAYAGESGSSSVVLPNSQKLVSVDGGAGANLNVQALRRAKKIFDANDIDEMIPRFICVSSSQLESLLGETEVTSSDFNSVKALVQGEIDTFLGFKFIRSERLPTRSGALSFDNSLGSVGAGAGNASGYKRCVAWAEDGVLLSIGKDMVGKIDQLPQKHYATQVYACMSVGGTRMEEEKVVEILCNEA